MSLYFPIIVLSAPGALIALAVRPDARAPGARSRDETIDPSSLGIRARPRSPVSYTHLTLPTICSV